MSEAIFTSKSVLAAYPWIPIQVLADRVKKGFVAIKNQSQKAGSPNRYTPEELVHAGVVDALAMLGILNDPDRVEVWVRDTELPSGGFHRYVGPNDFRGGTFFDYELSAKFSIDLRLYQRHQYHVYVRVVVDYDYHENNALRKYKVLFAPAALMDAEEEVSLWRNRAEYGQKPAIALLNVRRYFEIADFNLGMKPYIASFVGRNQKE